MNCRIVRSMKIPSALRVSLISALVLFPAARASAQAPQISGFAGYQFGGGFSSPVSGRPFDLGSGLAWGGALDIPINKTWRLEGLYSRQDTEITGAGLPGFNPSVRVERYMLGFEEEQHPSERLRPFGVILLGATRFVPKDSLYDPETHFAAVLGLGFKYYASQHVGFRFEGRASYTVVDAAGGAICGNGTCLLAFNGSGVWQGDVSGGLFLGF